MNEDKFYFKTDMQNDIKSIYRLVIDNLNRKVIELIWLNNQWERTDGLVRMITSGEFFLEPVTREQVRRYTPYVDTGAYQSR